jgi:AcrR family transcriptional regulator
MSQAREPAPPNPTVARILSAAEALFLDRTYADVTLDDVARAADVTKGAIYHHFAGKEQLYAAMLERDFAEKREAFSAALRLDGTARRRLVHLTRTFLALPAQKRRLIGLLRRDINTFRDPLRSMLVQAYQHALTEIVEEILRDGVEAGEIVPVDPRLLAWQFVATVELLLTPYATERFATDADKLAFAISIFMHGAARACPEVRDDLLQ